jgi:ribonuclease E
MPNKMLIDASHPEETRVVVLRGNRVEEFDFESADKKQLRGNIYLAKVTRVEPSLQAAFVDYGGNRHGFLAFPEIHPDYYQIPVVDRQALIEDEARAQRDDDEDEQRTQRRSRRFRQNDRNNRRADRRRTDERGRGETVTGELDLAPEDNLGENHRLDTNERDIDEEFFAEAASSETDPASVESEDPTRAEDACFGHDEPALSDSFDLASGASSSDRLDGDWQSSDPIEAVGFDRYARTSDESVSVAEAETSFAVQNSLGADAPAAVEDAPAETASRSEPGETVARWTREGDADAPREDEPEEVENLGGDAMEEVPTHRHRYRKQYKIQEVIKRRQILLVQVVKEERGNKGAALTTYLSLAGRYSVLMPNTARGGGISRKITDAADRQRLKSIVQELEVPEGMGVILRTAGAAKTKAEVKRDFEYLLRMWETVRETTLRSTAPTLVYEEGSLIKRAIRDLYNKDIDEIVVAGEEGYREAKEFMRLLMPSHAKNIQPYRDPQPLFARYGVEAQLDAMFSNQVTLKSGGYIVINQTEALVAIDVNSGRSTREHNIEDTALRTNLEAVDEIARQLRLRDLAGLIVLDLIDMEEARNNRAVERRLKEALKNDRARIQVGTISHFGLLEMSRQRIRSGVLEASTVVCPHCAGSGSLRSTASVALHILRVIEDALIKSATYDVTVKTSTIVALYILNQKRAHLRGLETRFGVALTIEADDTLTGSTYYVLERGELASGFVEPIAIAAPRMPEAILEQGDRAQLEHENFDRADSLREEAARGDVESAETIEVEGAELSSGSEDGSEAESEGRTRRRRRRRRGRGGDREVSGIAANAPQPPDDALAVIAGFGGSHDAANPTEIPSEIEPEAAIAAVDEAEPSAIEPPAVETIADRRRPRRPRAVAPVAEEEVSEPVVSSEPGSGFEQAASGEPPAIASAAQAEAEAPRPARARRGRRPTKSRQAQEATQEPAQQLAQELAQEEPAIGQETMAREPAASADETRLPGVASREKSTGIAEAGIGNTAVESGSDRAAEQGGPYGGAGLARDLLPTADQEPLALASTKPVEAREPVAPLAPAEDRPKRSGWWQRAKASSRS